MGNVSRLAPQARNPAPIPPYCVAYESKAKETAAASKPFTQIQKTNPTTAEN
jgi:hypothetical protein